MLLLWGVVVGNSSDGRTVGTVAVGVDWNGKSLVMTLLDEMNVGACFGAMMIRSGLFYIHTFLYKFLSITWMTMTCY